MPCSQNEIVAAIVVGLPGLVSLALSIVILIWGADAGTLLQWTSDSAVWGSRITLFSVILEVITTSIKCFLKCRDKEEIFPYAFYVGLTAAFWTIGSVLIFSCIILGDSPYYGKGLLATAAAFAIAQGVFWVIWTVVYWCHFRKDEESKCKCECTTGDDKGRISFYALWTLALVAFIVCCAGAISSAIKESNRVKHCRYYSTAAVASASKTCSEVHGEKRHEGRRERC